MNAFGRFFIATHVWLYRVTGGAIGGSFGSAGRVLLLTTTGRKTGQARTAPLMYFEDDGERYVVASNNGAPKHPVWYTNLVANRRVGVEVRGEKYEAEAEDLAGEERERVFTKLKAALPQFQGYETKVAGARVIPLLRLRRV